MNVATAPIRASAPGSIMVTGEHAVVYGHRALVAAIEQRVHVTLRTRTDQNVKITSEIAPPLEAELRALPDGGPYRFVLAALSARCTGTECGFDLDIRSEINPTLGLGSSAAVTVACLGALSRFTEGGFDAIHGDALAIVRAVQGRGSGADLAASLHGGLIAYRAPNTPDAVAEITALPEPPSALSLKYSGYKTPTEDVLRLIAERMVQNEQRFQELYTQMGRAAETAIAAAETNNWALLYPALNTYQNLMKDLGVSDQTLDQIIREARAETQTLAAKISGSGLGDCVLALGPTPRGFEPVRIAKMGLCFDD